MSRISLTIQSPSRLYILSECVSLTFEKERYTPYTTASGVFVCNSNPSGIHKLRVAIDGLGIHYGLVDSFEYYKEKGIGYVKFTSRGFSMGLSQNQPLPGMNYNVNLESLISTNISVPNVICEQNTAVANYIFVKENSSLWDAIVALCQKTNGTYPYISGENRIMFSKPTDNVLNLSGEKIIKKGNGVSLTSVVSHIHMKDTEDAYNYNYINQQATDFEIVRHKYINLDRQWLSDPDGGLMHKSNFAGRGMKYTFTKLEGCHYADLCTKVKLSSDETKEVSKIKLEFSKNGFFTTLWFYEDSYSA